MNKPKLVGLICAAVALVAITSEAGRKPILSALESGAVWLRTDDFVELASPADMFSVTSTNFALVTDGGVVVSFDYNNDFFPRFPLGFSTRDPSGSDNGFFVDASGNIGDALGTGWYINASGHPAFASLSTDPDSSNPNRWQLGGASEFGGAAEIFVTINGQKYAIAATPIP
jgi:hypothetical protein